MNNKIWYTIWEKAREQTPAYAFKVNIYSTMDLAYSAVKTQIIDEIG